MAERIWVMEIIQGFSIEGPGGGIGRFGIELSQKLDARHFEVTLCGLWNFGDPYEQEWIAQLRSRGIKAFTCADWDENKPYRSFWQAFRSLQSAVTQNPVDIIHSHSEFSDVAALLLKVRKNPPVIMRTVHYGFRYEWKKKPLRRLFLTNFLYPLLFANEIGVSQAIVDNLDRRWVAQKTGKKAIRIHNAVNLDRFENVCKTLGDKKLSLNIPEGVPVIGSVGRLTEQKGYPFLLEAMAIVLRHIPEAYLLIIGDGEMAGSLKELSRKLEIESHVVFAGSRPDVEELLGCMDLFASSSLWEGLPTVIMESMASGVPVVATDIPGTRELVKQSITGWMAPPGNPSLLAEIILKAISDPGKRREVAQNAREFVKDFSIQSVSKRYEDLYMNQMAASLRKR